MSSIEPSRAMPCAPSSDARVAVSANKAAAIPPKAQRADLARLKVVADICPQVFMRTLGLIAQRDMVPLSMSFEQRRTRLHFEIEIGGLSGHSADILVAKVGEQVRVRSARLIWSRKR